MTKQLPHPGADQITLTGVLAALSDPIRLAIVATLARTGERGWSEFELPVCKSTLSHHIKVLREAGIIQHRKDGTRCWITLRDELERASAWVSRSHPTTSGWSWTPCARRVACMSARWISASSR
jgi:DNA-binding transcriptional ArsR family regulator